MYFTTGTIAATLLAVHPAAADFSIFASSENQFPDPALTVTSTFFNNPPSCDDVVHSIGVTSGYENDASNGGFACDGCDISKAIPDWDITRFEINDDNDNIFLGPHEKMHMTLYKDEASGSYGLYDTDMTSLGSCERVPDPQEYQCGDVLSADTGMETFRCFADITIKDSN